MYKMKNVLELHALHFYQQSTIIIMFLNSIDNGSPQDTCMSRVEAPYFFFVFLVKEGGNI